AERDDQRNGEQRPAQEAGAELAGRSEVVHGTRWLCAEKRDSPWILAGCRALRNAKSIQPQSRSETDTVDKSVSFR
ncbi:MAG: hypothetical protein VW891_18605, partial [Novosphingobium sp.]